MKRLLVLLVVLCMLLTVPVLAGDEGDIKTVLAQVKERIPKTDNYEHFESSTREMHGQKVYTFSWATDDYALTMDVEANEDGIILEYYRYDGSSFRETSPTINKKTKAEVLPAAQKIVDKLNPALAGHLVVYLENEIESLYTGGYTFAVEHREGGVPVYGDSGTVTLAPDGETLQSFWLNYSKSLTYIDASEAISKERAQTAFAEHIGMKLSYQTRYENRTKSVYLSYQPKMHYGTYIDALTGEAVDVLAESFTAGTGNRMMYAEEAAAMDDDWGGFSAAEVDEFDKLDHLIGLEKAEKVVRETAVLAVPETAGLTSSSCVRDYYDENRYYYHLWFEEDGEDDYYYASATVDAVTSDILSFYQSVPYSREKNYTEEQLHDIGKSVALALCPEHIGQDGDYRIDEEEGGTLVYTRYVNDIPYRDNAVAVSVDEATGRVTDYSFSYDEMEFPDPSEIIDEAAAAQALFDQTDYVLTYYPIQSKTEQFVPDTTRLVYILSEGTMELDAYTGKPIDFYQEEDKLPAYTDIEGHWAEHAITTLAKYGIGFDEEVFRPDDIIVQKDFLSLMIRVVMDNGSVILKRDTDASSIYRQATGRGLIDVGDKEENANLTRSDAAVYMVRALGLEEIAKIEDIFNCPYDDVAKNRGYITILTGMKVFRGNGGKTFGPNEPLTRAAAMMMIYNYLSR